MPGIFPRSAATGPRAPFQTPILGLGGVQPRLPSSHLPSSCGQEGWGMASPLKYPLNPTYPHPLCERLTGIPGSARLGLGAGG